MLFPLLTALKVSLLLNACVFMCWIYLHAHLWAHDIPKRMHACVSLCVCKQIRLWASEIFQKSNAGLMPLPCDQRIRGFFHYLWRRNTFGCLPASLSRSLSLRLKGEESVGYQGNAAHRRSLLTRWKSSAALEFRNHEGWVAALLSHAKLERRVNSPYRLLLRNLGYLCAFPWNIPPQIIHIL